MYIYIYKCSRILYICTCMYIYTVYIHDINDVQLCTYEGMFQSHTAKQFFFFFCKIRTGNSYDLPMQLPHPVMTVA